MTVRDALTTRGWAFASAGGALLLAGLGLGLRDLTRIGVLLLALPLISGILARRHNLDVEVERTLRPMRVSVGDVATVRMEIVNRGRLSTPLLIAEERLDHVLGDRPRFLIARTRPGQRRRVDYQVRSHLRGRHQLGPVVVQVRDPFGMSLRGSAVGAPSRIVVRPRVVPLGDRHPPGSGVGAEGEIPFMVALHGEDDVSIREFRDGDDLRRIHWPATAHSGELMVRQEDRPARRRAIILLDPRESAHRGTGVSSSFESAVTATASIIDHLNNAGYAVHLVAVETVQDERAADALDTDRALDLLAVVKTWPAAELGPLVRAAQTVGAAGGLLVAVVAGGGEDELRTIASLRHPGNTALAMVIDPAGFQDGPPQLSAPRGADPADLFRHTGWSVGVLHQGQSVAEAWAGVPPGRRGVFTG
ncbi:MAG TPA: DUF58 domain-containing protein [Candidatus Lustribacter sp.]|nr:DUF58 domain-containing protein [Candidatus Lustribacter sp.]